MENQIMLAEPVTELEFFKHKGTYSRYTHKTGADYWDTWSWKASIQCKVMNKVFTVLFSCEKDFSNPVARIDDQAMVELLKDFGMEADLHKVLSLYEVSLTKQKELTDNIKREELKAAYAKNWAHAVYLSAVKNLPQDIRLTLLTEDEYIVDQMKDPLARGRDILSIFYKNKAIWYEYSDGWFNCGYDRDSKIRRKDFSKFLFDIAAQHSHKEAATSQKNAALSENKLRYDALCQTAWDLFETRNVSLDDDNRYKTLGREMYALVVKVAAPNGASVRVWDGQYEGTTDLVVLFGNRTFLAVDFIKAITTLQPITKEQK